MADRGTAVPAADVQKRFDYYQGEALKGPVVIADREQRKTVLMSYEDFVRLRGTERRVYRLADLPPDLEAALLDAKVPEGLPED